MRNRIKHADDLLAQKAHWDKAAKAMAENEAVWIRKLPPFQTEPTCPKCGDNAIRISFKQAKGGQAHNSDFVLPMVSGHMEHECGRCGYSWWTRPLDEPDQPANPPAKA